MIALAIHNGATKEDLNMSQMEYDSRLETINRFKETWDGEAFELRFMEFILQEDRDDLTKRYVPNSEDQESSSVDEEEDLTYGEMFKGLAKNIKQIAKSGVKLVPNEIHEQRFDICGACKHLNDKHRCMKCGCFMKIKTKFAAMKCPLGLW